MRNCALFLALLMLGASVFTGCSDDDSGGPTTGVLTVNQTFPADGAHDVNLNPLIEVWFNQPLDEASITWDCVCVEEVET